MIHNEPGCPRKTLHRFARTAHRIRHCRGSLFVADHRAGSYRAHSTGPARSPEPGGRTSRSAGRRSDPGLDPPGHRTRRPLPGASNLHQRRWSSAWRLGHRRPGPGQARESPVASRGGGGPGGQAGRQHSLFPLNPEKDDLCCHAPARQPRHGGKVESAAGRGRRGQGARACLAPRRRTDRARCGPGPVIHRRCHHVARPAQFNRDCAAHGLRRTGSAHAH